MSREDWFGAVTPGKRTPPRTMVRKPIDTRGAEDWFIEAVPRPEPPAPPVNVSHEEWEKYVNDSPF